ncbi:hypothetical protein VNI00_018634 [Paramarasmius palmivorus]|uniref:Uncharacterized protein n=1 Tax=Paramarasmius palmivorus TaxID=297713 RepID=A0AAW0AVX3_9AGAR
MDSITAFNGSGNASGWLQSFEEKFKKKSKSQKLKKLEKFLEGECEQWLKGIGSLGYEWVTAREAFVAYWVEGLRGKDFETRCSSITSPNADWSAIPINIVYENAPPLASVQKAISEAHPMFSTLVSTAILDPRGVYTKAFARFSHAQDQEAMFRVIWDAAYEAGRQCGVSEGRGQVRAESIEEGRQLGIVLAEQAAKREKEQQEARTMISVYVDTSDLTPEEAPTEPIAPTESTAPIAPIAPTESTAPIAPIAPIAPPATLTWADDADTIPPAVIIPPTTPPRDLTALCSTTEKKPFTSLQRRASRSHHFNKRHRNFHQYTIHTSHFNSLTPLVTRRHPSGIGPGKPVHTITRPQLPTPSSNRQLLPPLDWDRDPRLVQLGRILGDLGWVRA